MGTMTVMNMPASAPKMLTLTDFPASAYFVICEWVSSYQFCWPLPLRVRKPVLFTLLVFMVSEVGYSILTEEEKVWDVELLLWVKEDAELSNPREGNGLRDWDILYSSHYSSCFQNFHSICTAAHARLMSLSKIHPGWLHCTSMVLVKSGNLLYTAYCITVCSAKKGYKVLYNSKWMWCDSQRNWEVWEGNRMEGERGGKEGKSGRLVWMEFLVAVERAREICLS